MDEQDFPRTRDAIERTEQANGLGPYDDDEPVQGGRLLRALVEAPDGDTWFDSGSGSGWAIRLRPSAPPAE